ncbi:putative leucine-rich repeat-containing protein DDB_G0290503 isoform X2 [Prorops nasuta]|uniref:putative leucine-rich repeat-containing protein DDB_G0290503 isoform X2 n=1 Tax=Prorops nasuta TaxID=863751 RepID=UPI0034CD39CF
MECKVSTKPNSKCCFCGFSEDNEFKYGKKYEYDKIVTHYYCLLFSSNMEQKGTDNQGILGFLRSDIDKELKRGKKLYCVYCKKNGATVGCCNRKCKKIFHFPCGSKTGSLHQFFGEFRSYCKNHRPSPKIDENIIAEARVSCNLICYICYDQVESDDSIGTLWAPCCKKNAWFHRQCVQQLAMSAGYFFKCPLCNNKKTFQKAMLDNGIFIPSQDASWELVPNAFQELLYRHNRCDAEKCLCSKGRKYTSSNQKWKLILCKTCGSQGIHVECGALKTTNSIWECTECILILKGSEVKQSHLPLKDANDNESNLEKNESDSDSNSYISVGEETPSPLSILSYNPSLAESLNIKLLPGPRSFKLKQLREKQALFKKLNTNLIQEQTSDYEHSRSESKESDANFVTTILVNANENEKIEINRTVTKCKVEEDVIMIESDDDIQIIDIKKNTSLTNIIDLPKEVTISNLKDPENSLLYQENLENCISSVNSDPTMNIKITAVTSLAPNMFNSIPPPFFDNSNTLECSTSSASTRNENFKRKLENSRNSDISLDSTKVSLNSYFKKVRCDDKTDILTDVKAHQNKEIPSYYFNSIMNEKEKRKVIEDLSLSKISKIDDRVCRFLNGGNLKTTENVYNKCNLRAQSNIPEENCDGDTGTIPVESRFDPSTRYTLRPYRRRSSLSSSKNSNSRYNQSITEPSSLQSTETNSRSGFETFEVTNNPNNCDQPRMIPECVQLSDLNFRILNPNKLKMILYDMFSIDINLDMEIKSEPNQEYETLENMQTKNETLENETKHQIFDQTQCNMEYDFNQAKLKKSQKEDAKENLNPDSSMHVNDNLNMISNQLFFNFLNNSAGEHSGENVKTFSNSISESENETKNILVDSEETLKDTNKQSICDETSVNNDNGYYQIALKTAINCKNYLSNINFLKKK